MKQPSKLQPSSLKVFALSVFVALVTVACTSTGNSFNTQARNQLVVGETTLLQAVDILGADPVNTYRQLDGSATSIWSSKSSVMTDAIYLNQELWLAFGPDGRFVRVLKTHNLPQGTSSATPTDDYPMPSAKANITAAAPPALATPVVNDAAPVEVFAPTPAKQPAQVTPVPSAPQPAAVSPAYISQPPSTILPATSTQPPIPTRLVPAKKQNDIHLNAPAVSYPISFYNYNY